MKVPDFGELRSRLNAWLRPARLADPDDDRVAATLNTLGLSFAAIGCGWLLLALWLVPDPRASMLVTGCVVALLLVTVALGRRGFVRAGSTILVASIWLSAMATALWEGGTASPSASTVLLAVIAAGLLFRPTIAFGVAGFSAAATGVLALLEAQGSLPVLPGHTGLSRWWILSMLMAGAAALVVDTTRRFRSAADRDRLQRSRLRELFDGAPEGIVVLDRELQIEEVNARLCQLSGYDRDALVGSPASSLLADDEDMSRLLGSEAGSGDDSGRDGVVSSRLTLRARDGTDIPIETHTSPMSDGRIQVAVRDIREIVAAFDVRERLERALAQTTDGLAVFGPDAKIVYSNAAFAEFYQGPTELIDKRIGPALAYSDSAREMMATAWQALKDGHSWQRRDEYTQPDGPRRVLEVRLSPVTRSDGALTGAVCVFSDVTREVELEETLRQSLKLEAVGRLAGGVAHDFNNLLTIILAEAELLRENAGEDESLRRTAREIAETARRGADLTAQLLAFGRKQVVRPCVLDLNASLRSSADLLRRLLRANFSLEIELASEPVNVEIDPTQLHQVLINLVANGRDAMPDGGRLVLGVQASDGEGEEHREHDVSGWAELSLRDEGVGMAHDTLDHIFEPFFTTKPLGKGTGLGLSTVHGIVVQAGGTIEVHSEIGKGSEFRIRLPRVFRAPETAADMSAPLGSVPEGVRIMLVEDEPSVRRLAAGALRRAGYQVVEAEDGESALEMVEKGEPSCQILVTDIVLPGRDGIAVSVRLREHWPDVQVLFTSGYPREELRADLSDPNAEFLEKPFTPSALEHKIRELFHP